MRFNEIHTESANRQPSIDFDQQQKKLTIRGVNEFPQEIFEYADHIEILDMSGNMLTSLPDSITTLKNMRIAFFSGNMFSEVPKALANCNRLEMVGLKSCGIESIGEDSLPTSLRGLILTDNNIAELPDSIGRHKRLQKLMLTGNELTSLPSLSSPFMKVPGSINPAHSRNVASCHNASQTLSRSAFMSIEYRMSFMVLVSHGFRTSPYSLVCLNLI